jgi:transcriptional regulator with XRE-family HTH domain
MPKSLEELSRAIALRAQKAGPKAERHLKTEDARAALAVSLVRLRGRRGLKQEEVARRAGLNQSEVSRAEVGGGNPTLNTLLRIVVALDGELEVRESVESELERSRELLVLASAPPLSAPSSSIERLERFARIVPRVHSSTDFNFSAPNKGRLEAEQVQGLAIG